MIEQVSFRCRAFLSYSHKDTKQAKRLHKALESFRIDKDLAGRKTQSGTIPKSLRPIFRDREDFSAGHSLTDQTLAALKASPFLVLLCSQNSAQSQYVNEEVRLFKSMGNADAIIPVIIDGEPGHPEQECFPLALKYELDKEGNITNRSVELLAADIRDEADGWSLAVAKVASRLLGLSTDEVYRRAERARRLKGRIRNGVIASLLILTVAATATAVFAYQKLLESEERLDQAIEIAYSFVNEAAEKADQFGVPTVVTQDLLRRAETALNNLLAKGGSSHKLRYRKAQMLTMFSENYGRVLGSTNQLLSRAIEAQNILERLVDEAPRNLKWKVSLGQAYLKVGDSHLDRYELKKAMDVHFKCINVLKQVLDQSSIIDDAKFDLGRCHERIGYNIAEKDWDRAYKHYKIRHESISELVEKNPSNPKFRRDLSVSHNKLGGVFLATEKTDDALEHYRTGLSIMEVLLKESPNNSRFRYDLGISHERIGNIYKKQNKLELAMREYQAKNNIIKKLHESDKTNQYWEIDLAVSYSNIGFIFMEMGDYQRATSNYIMSKKITENLVKKDPSNIKWKRHLESDEFQLKKLDRLINKN